MKKIFVAITCFTLLICFGSCKKVDQLLTFSISNEDSFTVAKTFPIGLPFDIMTPDNTTNSSEAFANNNTDASHVKNIYLKNLTLTTTSPANQNFNFVKSITIYISTDSSNEIELASINNIPQNVTTIALTPTTAALDTYVKAPSYNLRTVLVMDEALTQDVTIKEDSKFQVTATL